MPADTATGRQADDEVLLQDACPHCGADLGRPEAVVDRGVTDLVEDDRGRLGVRLSWWNAARYTCPGCGDVVVADVPAEFRNTGYGTTLGLFVLDADLAGIDLDLARLELTEAGVPVSMMMVEDMLAWAREVTGLTTLDAVRDAWTARGLDAGLLPSARHEPMPLDDEDA